MTVKRSKVFLYKSHNLTPVICLHTVCTTWPRDRNPSGTTTPGPSGLGSNGNKGVLHILEISKDRASPSDNLMSYLRHSLAGLISAEMQMVYSTAPAEWAQRRMRCNLTETLKDNCKHFFNIYPWIRIFTVKTDFNN